MFILLAIIAGLMLMVERLWPGQALPSSRGWWLRIALVNLTQLGIVLLAGQTWDQWFRAWSLLSVRAWPVWAEASLAYLISTFVYYWWHRVRHESDFFWRLCHQLHHSPRRIEVLASFYKHPVEITLNALISSSLIYLLLGCSLEAAALYTGMTAVAEYFYHWNIRTPRWLGPWFQRPESHRVHHRYQHHTQNYADLPVWDLLFGTYHNPHESPKQCGFDAAKEQRIGQMLCFQDVHQPTKLPLTCMGCRKRWACMHQRRQPLTDS